MNLRSTLPDEDWALSNAYARFHLSNGQVIYDDEDDPNEPFWFRLQDYLRIHNLRITLIVLKFRSNEIHFTIRPDERYVYFTFGAGRDSGNDHTDRFYVVGRQDSNDSSALLCTWYKTPELVKFQDIVKPLAEEVANRRACVLPVL